MHALVLHNMGDPARWREAIADLELAFVHYAEDVRCIVHDAALRLPEYVRDFPFDLIVLNSTFLGAVTDPKSLARVREQYRFLTDSPAFKLALPQDDYYCSEELDALFTDWRVDLVNTVCPEHWDILYPRYRTGGGAVQLGYTGYVTPRMRALIDVTVPRAKRTLDVVYRATGRPGFPNEMAVIKARLGAHFSAQFGDRPWRTDITTDDRRVIAGAAWWRFLASSRTTLGSNSGSSVLIRNLDVAGRVRAFQREHPDADYAAVVEACTPPADRALEFTAISPRVLEAALVETTQLLVPGPYSGAITEGDHYWPLAPDCSNRDEIIQVMGDHALQSRLAAACKEAIVNTPALQVEGFVADICSRVARHRRGAGATPRRFALTRARYGAHAGLKNRIHYARERIRR